MTNKNTVKKLFRSKSDRFIGGVSGGLGQFFNIDANIFRILFVVFSLIGGIGLILYIVSLFLIPENPEAEEAVKNNQKDKTKFFALLFIILGVFLLIKNMGIFDYFSFWHVSWTTIWAILLIVIGLLLIYSSKKSSGSKEDSDSAGISLPDVNKINRSKTNKMLAGVCAGIAEYLNIDPSIVRIIWVIASIGTMGLGLLLYIILIFVFPEGSDQTVEEQK